MNPSFSTSLVNDVFGDPGLYVDIRWSNRALLFDLGTNDRLGPTRLLRATDIFVSHTHMDHFIGFDAVLRVALARGKTLPLFGSPGLIENGQGKLRRYTWNLVDGYPLRLRVQEFHHEHMRQALFPGFRWISLRRAPGSPNDWQSVHPLFPVLEDPMFCVKAVALNHRIPSFAYSLEKQCHINVNKQRLHEAGRPVGAWLKDVKQYIWQGRPNDFWFTVALYEQHRRQERDCILGGDQRPFSDHYSRPKNRVRR